MNDDFPILAAIAASPTNPHRVLDHLQAIGIAAERSTLYRRLDALIGDGLVEAKGGSGPRARRLSLAAGGRKLLALEATRVLETEPLESPRFALAVTCAGLESGTDLVGVLRARMAETAQRLTAEERVLRSLSSRDEYWNIAGRERRVAHLQADIAWLQSIMGRRTVARTGPSGAREAELRAG